MASLLLLISKPKQGARLLRLRAHLKKPTQIGVNTLLFLCFSPLATTIDTAAYIGVDHQPTFSEWFDAALHDVHIPAPYLLLKILVMGVIGVIIIDALARISLRHVSHNNFYPEVTRVKYLACVPAVFGWIVIECGWNIPLWMISKIENSSKFLFFAILTTSLSVTIFAVVAVTSYYGSAAKSKSLLSNGSGVILIAALILPVTGCVSNLLHSGFGAREMANIYYIKNEPAERILLTGGTSCLIKNGRLLADIVLHNPYGKPIFLQDFTTASIGFEDVHNKGRDHVNLLMQQAHNNENEPSFIIIPANSYTSVKFTQAKDITTPENLFSAPKMYNVDKNAS
jgi:hypothetical protein